MNTLLTISFLVFLAAVFVTFGYLITYLWVTFQDWVSRKVFGNPEEHP